MRASKQDLDETNDEDMVNMDDIQSNEARMDETQRN